MNSSVYDPYEDEGPATFEEVNELSDIEEGDETEEIIQNSEDEKPPQETEPENKEPSEKPKKSKKDENDDLEYFRCDKCAGDFPRYEKHDHDHPDEINDLLDCFKL